MAEIIEAETTYARQSMTIFYLLSLLSSIFSSAYSQACITKLVIGALIGFFNAAVYQDLMVWSAISVAFAIVFIICAIKTKRV